MPEFNARLTLTSFAGSRHGTVEGAPDDVLDRFSSLLAIEQFVLDYTPRLTKAERAFLNGLFASWRVQKTCMPRSLGVHQRDTLRGLVLRALATGYGPGRGRP
jgi:hypothetical protein